MKQERAMMNLWADFLTFFQIATEHSSVAPQTPDPRSRKPMGAPKKSGLRRALFSKLEEIVCSLRPQVTEIEVTAPLEPVAETPTKPLPKPVPILRKNKKGKKNKTRRRVDWTHGLVIGPHQRTCKAKTPLGPKKSLVRRSRMCPVDLEDTRVRLFVQETELVSSTPTSTPSTSSQPSNSSQPSTSSTSTRRTKEPVASQPLRRSARIAALKKKKQPLRRSARIAAMKKK